MCDGWVCIKPHGRHLSMYNMETRKVVLSRDVKWAEWEKLKPTHGMSVFEKKPELLKEECCVKKAKEYEIINMDEEHYERQVIQPVQNPIQPVQNAVKAAPQQPAPQQPVTIETRAMKQARLKKEAEDKAEDKARKLARQMAALNTFSKRVTRSKSQVNAVEEVYIGEEEIQTVNFMDTTAAKPKSFKEAVNGPEKVEWMESMISEVMNFLTRKSWKMVNKLVPQGMKKTIVKSKWVFKKKTEQDNSLRFKSRVVSKGYMQKPGVDYQESFSPVATASSIRMG